MTGLERQYLRECIEALCRAYTALLRMSCDDAVPERQISDCLCEKFDPYLPLVTEEIGTTNELRGTEEEVVCFSDPMDRSNVLANFLSKHSGKIKTIFQQKKIIKDWESNYGGHLEISGPYGSITAVRHHYILFNVVINYMTGRLYIASDDRVGSLHVSKIFEDSKKTSLKRTKHLIDILSPISFGHKNYQNGEKKFATFCADKSKRDKKKYEDNLIASKIFGNESIDQIRNNYLKYEKPGGPARILYLKDTPMVGFILSNGEKICEWLGWLAYVRYFRPKLRAYEIVFDSSWQRDQVLMAPGPAYSILGNKTSELRGCSVKEFQLNMQKLKYLGNHSQYRSTILVCPESNREVTLKMNTMKCTELIFSERK